MNRNQFRLGPWLVAIALMILVVTGDATAASWKEKVLYSFQGNSDGSIPAGGVVLDASGNLYGVTSLGGASFCSSTFECGTVYQLQPPGGPGKSWTYVKLHQFKGHDHGDGSSPEGGMLIDASGNLYGTTQYGGSGPCVLLVTAVGCGTVFQLIPPKQKGGSWTEKILYHFQGNKDGYAPHGDLVVDASGNLYGATNFGGGGGQSTCDSFYPYCGTVFEVSPPKTKGGKWTEKVLYSFQNKTDGAVPNGSLVFDKQGALYGTTYCGGSVECQDLSGGSGVGFRLKPPSQNGGRWSYKLLYSFKGNPGDGGNSRAGMIFDAKGSLYGTTQAGGNPRGDGTVFQLTRHGKGRWKESIFHTFNFNDAVFPMAELVFGASGELYGTASQGGANGGGAVFQMKFLGASGWTYQRLYDFSAVPDGNEPESSLIVDHAGSLYGATLLGGTGTACTFGCGTVYELQP